MADDLDLGVGFGPGFGQQPNPTPEPALVEQASPPADAVADYTDRSYPPLPRVAALGSRRPGRRPQPAGVELPVLGVLHPGAVGQGQPAGGGSPWTVPANGGRRAGLVRRVLSHCQPKLLTALKPISITSPRA